MFLSRFIKKIMMTTFFLIQIQQVTANTNYLVCGGHVVRMGYDYTGNILAEIMYRIGTRTFSTQLLKLCSLKENITTGRGIVITPSDCQQFQSILQTQKTMGKRVFIYFSNAEKERFESATGATLTRAVQKQNQSKNTCMYSKEARLKRFTPYAIYTN